MKKIFVAVIAIVLMGGGLLTSCKKDTMSNFLTAKDGWMLSSVKCTHELKLSNGTIIPANTELVDETSDYANGIGYFYDYEMDNIYKFVATKENPSEGVEYINGNKKLGDGAESAEDKPLGAYVINEDTKVLGLYLPWAPNSATNATIKSLDKKEMELICNYTIEDEIPAKLDAGDYTFYVTFKAQ